MNDFVQCDTSLGDYRHPYHNFYYYYYYNYCSSGYIHRLRGYHGLGERTYYHSTGYVDHPQIKRSYGQGFPREWRSGWTDDEGYLI